MRQPLMRDNFDMLRRLPQAEPEPTGRADALAAAQSAVHTVDALGESVALMDMDGKIRSVNAAFVTLTEHDRQTLEGMNIRNVLPEVFTEDDGAIEQKLARASLMLSKEDPHDALRVVTRQGAQKWVFPTLSTIYGHGREPAALLLTLRDVTALVEAQAQLRASEARYRELVENANSIILRLTPDGRILFFNEYAQRFFRYGADEVAGRHLLGTLVPETDSEGRDLRPRVAALVAHPELHGHSEYEGIRRDGQRVWIHWSTRAVRDPLGNVSEILCVGTDVTERRRLTRQAEDYRRRLRALGDRLAATEEQERRRISTHIHDTVIQTLSLANIRLGAVRRAAEEAGLPDQTGRIDGIRKLIDGGISECRSLMADLTPPLLYELGLGAALEEFAEKQQALHGTPIRVEADGAADLPDESRRGLLFQCAQELVMNALKYAGPCNVAIRLAREDNRVRLTVSDTGRGFDPARTDLFDADDEGGFGLFNIRERLQSVGGRFDIESAPGRGVTAVIELPAER
ncbi:MAG: PAS domain S-box protein [Lentisphaerae bacterium]|nr:PAS domain S-box protein [Lentisphaerota bacterium]